MTMNDGIAASHGRSDGLLRKFEDGDHVSSPLLVAKICQDGSFCAALSDSGLFTFSVLNHNPTKAVVSEDVTGFFWSRHIRDTLENLSLPNKKEYLVVTDGGINIHIFSISKEAEKQGNAFCKVELVSFIGRQIFHDGISETENIKEIEIIDASYKDCSCYHEIIFLVDNKDIVQIGTKTDGEPTINLRIPLFAVARSLQVDKFVCWKVKNSLLFIVSQLGVLYIISLSRRMILEKVELMPEHSNRNQTDDYFLQDMNNSYGFLQMCDISNDLRYILAFGDDEGLNLFKMNIDEIEVLEESFRLLHQQSHVRSIINIFYTEPIEYGIDIQNKVWKSELNSYHQELIKAEYSQDEDFDFDQMHQKSLGSEGTGIMLAGNEIVTLPEWTKGCKIEQILAGNDTVLIKMTLKIGNISSDENASIDQRNCILLKIDLKSNNYIAQSLPDRAIIAKSENRFFPHCILTNEAMYVPTFDATQEELISSIIQYTGIAEAEEICRSNDWNQFSIPLHSLEVGLQHRQVDTISFFLRTRDKAFSRYWRSASQSSLVSGTSGDRSNGLTSSDPVGSPSSLKSVLIKSPLESTTIDPSELHKAVEMLVKAIQQNSKGKHKKNFFETLLRLTIDFLTSLIMDGTEVWENVLHRTPMSSTFRESSRAFLFLVDVPESLKYLAECIVDIRQFVGDIPDFYTVQEEQCDVDFEDNAPKHHDVSLKEYMETEITAGRISRLQQYLFEHSELTQIEGDLDCSFDSIVEFGHKFALRKLIDRNMDDAVVILKNLGSDHKAILRQLFEVTLDKGLRNFLLAHFRKEPFQELLSEDDWKDVMFLNEVEKWYPCNVYSNSNSVDTWETLKTNFHDIDDIEVTDEICDKLTSLVHRDTKDVISTGLYSELTFNLVKQWDDKSRKMVLLDAAFQSNQTENLADLADSETLWEYLINHNDEERIFEWIKISKKRDNTSLEDQRYPSLDPNFIEKCGNATEQLQKSIYLEFLRLGIYTEFMQQNFDKSLKLMSEDCLLLKKSDDSYSLSPLFSNQFIAYCVKNNFKEMLYIFLDNHGLYPNLECLHDQDLNIDDYPWFKMMISFRNYQKDKSCIFEMNLSTAENILNVSGDDLKYQLCLKKPLTTLSILLTSSLELNKVFNRDGSSPLGFDGSALKESLKQYPTLFSALFKDTVTDESAQVTAIQLLQDNSNVDAKKFFDWRLQTNLSENDSPRVPNFSSKDLVEKYGMVVSMSFSYYLQQRRPVHAYLVFMKDLPSEPTEKQHWFAEAYSKAYDIATANFDSIPIASACISFVQLLRMDNLAIKVDIESANFVLENYSRRDDEQYDTKEKLKSFIVTSLRSRESGRTRLLQMLEECVEAGLKRDNIEWSSFEAILYYRIAVQFAHVSNLSPSTRIIKETVKDGCWFHAIVYVQLYQLKPSEIIPALEKSMTNKTLLDHLCAIIKNAKEMRKMTEQPTNVAEKRKKVTQVEHGPKSAALEKDFRAQFYFNLKKGQENRPIERAELVSPTKAASASSRDELTRREGGLGKLSSGSVESIDEKPAIQPTITLDAIQPLDDILDIVMECEETGYPSRMLLKYALHYSQPFLAVLAASYKESIALNCLSVWIISSAGEKRRDSILQNVADVERWEWTIEAMFDLLSAVMQEEENAITIIAQGFTIFMKENLLFPFFSFCELFTAKENDDVCVQHLKAFTARLYEHDSEDDRYAEQFLEKMIPIKVLLAFDSKFYKRKLLQHYIDTGLENFQTSSSLSFTSLSKICEITKNTDIVPEYLKLASSVKDDVIEEEDRIYELLIEQRHLAKAAELAKSLDLPSWKVTFSQVKTELAEMKGSGLWQSCESRFQFWMSCDVRLKKCACSCTVAGAYFEAQGMTTADLPYEERALLLAMAYHWYNRSKGKFDDESREKEELEFKLHELEKKVWLFKINAEMEKFDFETTDEPNASHLQLFKSCNLRISEFLDGRTNKRSVVGLQNDDYGRNLLVHEDVFTDENKTEHQPEWSKKENEAFEVIIGQLLENCEITQAKRVAMLFGKEINNLNYVLSAISLAQGTKQVESLDESIKSLLAKTPKRSLSVSGSYETAFSFNRSISTVESAASPGLLMADWVLIEEVQNAIEKLLSKCKKGKKCCERILVCFKISKILSMTYREIVSLEHFRVLRLLIYSDMDQQRQLCRQYIKAFDLKEEEIAAFIAKVIVRIIKSKANIELSTLTVQEFTDTTKLNSNEIPPLMQLVQQPSLLGTFLLEEAKTMETNAPSENDINILEAQVELLVRAHDCFTLSCNMEGISEVLHLARLCSLQLVRSKAYSLMVRILTGIGRFKEMSYIFEALAEEHHFELLFRKNIDKEAQLKNALLDYIKKHHPNDTEKMDLLSMRFGMHREVGEQLEETGEKQIATFTSMFPGSVKDLEQELKSIIKTFSYAAENFRKVNCLRQSARCKKVARLAELQIRLLPTSKQIIGLEKQNLTKLLSSHPDFYEALLIADGCNFSSVSTWVDPLFERVVVKGEMSYLKQYLSVYQLKGSVVNEIVMRYRSERTTSNMNENLRKILMQLKDIKSRYKIAHDLGFNDMVNDLLDGPQGAFLKDYFFSF